MADTYNLAAEAPGDVAAIADRVTGLHVADVSPDGDAGRARRSPARGQGRTAEIVAALRERRLGRHARRRDLLDTGCLLGASGRRGGPSRARRGLGAALTVGADAATVPLDDLDTLWEFDDPAESERRFAALLPRAQDENDGALHARFSRSSPAPQGLQRRFDEARRTLVDAERELRSGDARGHVRILLERGRLDRAENARGWAARHSVEAWDFARAGGEDGLAVDAGPHARDRRAADDGVAWNERAMELARSSADPAARRWVGSLASNMGWARHDAGDFDGAIALFELARDEWLADGRVDRARIARWSIARCPRASQATSARRSPSRRRFSPSSRRSARPTATSSRRSASASSPSVEATRPVRSSHVRTTSSRRTSISRPTSRSGSGGFGMLGGQTEP